METIDLGPLPVFVAVAETSSFSAAAQKLSLPKSSVSRTIAALEAAMGVRLLHRTTRRVSLSTAGQALYEKVAPLLAQLKKSVGEVPELGEEPLGQLKVTVAVDVGVAVLAGLVARFLARYPLVDVDLHLSNRLVDLVSEGYDVALRVSSQRLKDSSLKARAAGEVALQLYAAPTYLARAGTPRTAKDLEAHAFVAFRSHAPLLLEGTGGKLSITPRGRLLCDDMFFVREAVRNGAGVGLLPTFLAQPDVVAGALTPLLSGYALRTGRLWVVTPNAEHVPRKATAFRDFIVDSLRQRPLAPAL